MSNKSNKKKSDEMRKSWEDMTKKKKLKRRKTDYC